MSDQALAPRRLRIAVLNRHFGYRFGGAERYAAAIVEALAAQHDVHVFAQEIEHSFPGVTYHRVSRPLAKPRWFNQLWFALLTWWQTRRGFDVVHSHENTWHGQVQTVHVRPFKVGLFHGRQGFRRVLRWLSLCTSLRLMVYWWLEAARMRPQARRQIVATSTQVMTETLQAYPQIAACMHVVAPGVNFPDRPSDTIAARQRLRLPQDVQLGLFVGNDHAKKGLGTLLAALAQHPDLHLAVVGSGQHTATFERQVQQMQLAERVHFLGSLPDVSPAYEAADVLVHPTTEDTYAMVVLEAMAHGLPVIVSSAPYCGISTELRHEQQALILEDPRNAQALSEHLKRLLSHPELRQHLARSGRQFASERSWLAVAQQHEALFLSIAQSAL